MRIAEDMIIVDKRDVRDLRDQVLNKAGRLKVMPASFYENTTPEERALLGHNTGSYLLPTEELVDRLLELVGPRIAIEIGAGNGCLARAMGITATDSYQHRKQPWKSMFGDKLGKLGPPVPYGPNVKEMDARLAVRHYQPEVVVAAWVSHLDSPFIQQTHGNPAGVDEMDVLAHCGEYIFIGDENVHRHKPIWDMPHTIEYPPFVYSRATNGARQMIVRWAGHRQT